MTTPSRRPPVRVLAAGAALTLSAVACADKGPSSPAGYAPSVSPDPSPDPGPDAVPPSPNPPPPGPPPQTDPPAASDGDRTLMPDAPEQPSASTADERTHAVELPQWDEVPSGHPPGATNPPLPVLEVTQDGTRCFKAWQSPMMRNPDLWAIGGRVLASADAAQGTEVACEVDKAAALLDRHAKHEAAGAAPGPARTGK